MPVLFSSIFLVMASFAVLLPSVMYVLENMGVEKALATMVLAGYSVAQFITGPMWGRLSDDKGRKPILMLSLFMAGCSYGLLAVFSDSVFGVFIGYACAGLCAGNSAVVYAAVTDLTTAENRTKGMGMMGAGIGLAFMIGPAVGAIVSGKTAAMAGLAVPATISVCLCLLGMVLVGVFFKESISPTEGGGAVRMGRVKALVQITRRPVLFQMCLMMFVFTFALAMMEPILPYLTNERHGWGPREMGYVFTYVGLIMVIVQGGLIKRLSARFGEQKLAKAGLFFMAVGLLCLVLLHSLPGLFLGLTFTSISGGLFNTSMLTLASHRSSGGERGLVMGVFQSMQALGRSSGPMIAGALFQLKSELPLFVGAVFMITSLFWLMGLYRLMQRRRVSNP